MITIGEPLYDVSAEIQLAAGVTEEIDATEIADTPVCILWIPDCEQRHGWREFYVKRQVRKPGTKRMGYKK